MFAPLPPDVPSENDRQRPLFMAQRAAAILPIQDVPAFAANNHFPPSK